MDGYINEGWANCAFCKLLEGWAVMNWKAVDITTPGKWYRSKCWRWRNTSFIVSLAYCPTHFSIGGELLTGFGKGIAFCIGPLWFGFASTFPENSDGQAEH